MNDKRFSQTPHNRSVIETDTDANLLQFFALLYRVDCRLEREKRERKVNQQTKNEIEVT